MQICNQNPAPRLIDLGAASTETKGAFGVIIEPMGLWHRMGISDA